VSLELQDPKVGQMLGGRYRLEERLGAGGMGVVYRGEEVPSGRAVAVKFLHEALAGIKDLVKRFDREVQAMSRLRHPHLVEILDSGLSNGVPYLVMEFHEGRSLADVLERGALPAGRAIRIARQVLEGVAEAHASGVVHRDLKPDNILLVGGSTGESVKILDFGLAKMAEATGGTQLTNTGFALGTPAYMAPEQAKGSPTDHRADLYAVGVILYHMVVGEKPFQADAPMAVLRMHMDDAPVPPRKAAPDANLSAALETVILRAMEKSPARRWQSAQDFIQALDDVESGVEPIELEPTMAAKAGAVQKKPATRPVRRSRGWMWKAAAVLVLAGGGVFAWQHLSRRDQQKVKQTLDTAVDKAKDALRAVADVEKPPEKPPEKAKPPEKKADDFDDAVRLVNAGKIDEGVKLLYQLREKAPRSPGVALWLGHAYFRKNWRSDGLAEYEHALDWSPSFRSDQTLIKNAVMALDDPTFKSARYVLRRVGRPALPELRRTVRTSKNAKLQARANRVGVEIARAR
jgi:serine/threonine-protein kinase